MTDSSNPLGRLNDLVKSNKIGMLGNVVKAQVESLAQHIYETDLVTIQRMQAIPLFRWGSATSEDFFAHLNVCPYVDRKTAERKAVNALQQDPLLLQQLNSEPDPSYVLIGPVGPLAFQLSANYTSAKELTQDFQILSNMGFMTYATPHT